MLLCIWVFFFTGWGWNAPTASTPAPGKMFLLWWLRLCIPPPSFCWTFIPFPLSSLPVCIFSSLLFPPACLSPLVSFRFGVSGKTFEMGFSSAHRWSCREPAIHGERGTTHTPEASADQSKDTATAHLHRGAGKVIALAAVKVNVKSDCSDTSDILFPSCVPFGLQSQNLGAKWPRRRRARK